jgi:protein involved in polysaccharide export with SLBB domain
VHEGQLGSKPERSLSTKTGMEQEADPTAPDSARIIGPITARSDFEKFAEDAAGHPLPVYGRQLFEEVSSTFAPMDHIPVPSNYAIGPGDELLIRVWGKVDLDASVTVDRNGQVSLPRVGTLNVAGLRYEQVEGYLRKAVGIIYKDFELNVTLGRLRSIQVFVLGSARQPGAYTDSSLSTSLNALFASGGPSATGTLRRIQVRRGSQTIAELDLYDVLRKGDKSHDVQLLPGDVIYIPQVGPQVAIVDNVSEPGIYELKGETTVASSLENAGGLTNLAGTDRVLLERIQDHKKRRVEEFALDASGMQRILKDGDSLHIFPISPQFENAVTLRGSVAAPGRFGWHEGQQVTDLIPSRDFLITSDHWIEQNHQAEKQRAEVTRKRPAEPAGNPPVELARNLHAEQIANQNVELTENQTTEQTKNQRTDLLTQLDLTNSEINWEYALIERIDQHDLSTRLIAFNLGHAIDDPASADNQLLRAGDVITVFSRKDIPLPLEKHSTIVRVGGEVNAPGLYRVNPGETLREVVQRAGGLTPHSYLYASELTRVSARKLQEAQLKRAVSRMQKELLAQYGTARSLDVSAVANTKAQDQQVQLKTQQDLIEKLSSEQPTGRVVLDISPDAKLQGDLPDLVLEDGDSLFIPAKLGTIQVVGEVYNESAFRFEAKKRLAKYLNAAGGATRQADVKRIFLIRADGTVVSRQAHRHAWQGSFDDIELMPGDSIIVPLKLKAPGGMAEQWPLLFQTLSQTAMTGALIGTR